MLSFLLNSTTFVLSFIVILSLLVFFHELGHYSVARFFKVAVERFSIGFGKPLMAWRARSGTVWSVNAIPLGGYVKFMGDSGAASNPDRARLAELKQAIENQANEGPDDPSEQVRVEDCFHFKPLWQRVLIVLAGPVANFLLAIVIFAVLAMAYGTAAQKSVVAGVMPGSAAEAAGVQTGDQFLLFDGNDVSRVHDLIPYVVLRSGVEIDAEVKRGSDTVRFSITPRRQERRDAIGGKAEMGTIGVTLGGQGTVIRETYGPLSSIGYGVDQVGATLSATGLYIKRIFTGQEDGKALGGVVRIATMTGKTAIDATQVEAPLSVRIENLVIRLLSLAAAISVGLGVANLMPIPVLDGGHLLYYGYEAVAGRPLNENIQEMGFRIGLALLLTLMVILTLNDIVYIQSLFS